MRSPGTNWKTTVPSPSTSSTKAPTGLSAWPAATSTATATTTSSRRTTKAARSASTRTCAPLPTSLPPRGRRIQSRAARKSRISRSTSSRRSWTRPAPWPSATSTATASSTSSPPPSTTTPSLGTRTSAKLARTSDRTTMYDDERATISRRDEARATISGRDKARPPLLDLTPLRTSSSAPPFPAPSTDRSSHGRTLNNLND
mmetsp:Transcript_3219/g.10647  ORF Transcript_3219/g.10647 Transcript_3219/m.10647 type:complete len:202 (+) Transcript_3219:780-1385(+)